MYIYLSLKLCNCFGFYTSLAFKYSDSGGYVEGKSRNSASKSGLYNVLFSIKSKDTWNQMKSDKSKHD